MSIQGGRGGIESSKLYSSTPSQSHFINVYFIVLSLFFMTLSRFALHKHSIFLPSSPLVLLFVCASLYCFFQIAFFLFYPLTNLSFPRLCVHLVSLYCLLSLFAAYTCSAYFLPTCCSRFFLPRSTSSSRY